MNDTQKTPESSSHGNTEHPAPESGADTTSDAATASTARPSEADQVTRPSAAPPHDSGTQTPAPPTAPAVGPDPQSGQSGASGTFSQSGTNTEPTAPFTDAGGAAAGAASLPRRYRPLFGTILWGVILLAFAASIVIWTIVPATLDPSLWLLGGVIAVGLVLVVAGIAAASRRAG